MTFVRVRPEKKTNKKVLRVFSFRLKRNLFYSKNKTLYSKEIVNDLGWPHITLFILLVRLEDH